jgi:TM2 domain-containing membrane protein YozV
MKATDNTHLKSVGYILSIFGFTGSHRCYFGKPISGAFYFFTPGLLGIGWIIDLFPIPSLFRQATIRFHRSPNDYTTVWVILMFLGLLGIRRMAIGK